MPLESGNFETNEIAEDLTPEENAVVEKALELFKLTNEKHIDFSSVTIENSEQVARALGEDWKKLNDEYLEKFNTLSSASQERVTEKEQEELKRLGLIPHA